MEKKSFTVLDGENSVQFELIIHEVLGPGELLIEDEFYEYNDGKIPVGKHWEIEIISPAGIKGPGTHVHTSKKNGKEFVCWPFQLASYEQALAMLKIWMVGTVFTLNSGKRMAFDAVFNINIKDFDINDTYFEAMGKIFGIKIK